MAFTIKRTYDWDLVITLYRKIFPTDEFTLTQDDILWIVYNGKKPVGFCSLCPLKHELGVAFCSAAGLLWEARGKKLHKRMIRVRTRWAKKNGIKTLITYTVYFNTLSARNLLSNGFELYLPAYKWAGTGMLYFRKDL